MKLISALTVAILLATTVNADPTPPPPAEGHVNFQTRPKLTVNELISEADRTVTKMELAGVLVRNQLEQARAQKDVVKVLCLNDKVSQMDVAVRSARERRSSLTAALSRDDRDLANHEFTLLSILRQRAEQLTAEANQCVGEEAAVIGQSRVVVVVDPTLAGTPGDNANVQGTGNNNNQQQPGGNPQGPGDNGVHSPPVGSKTTTTVFRNAQGQEIRLVVTVTQ